MGHGIEVLGEQDASVCEGSRQKGETEDGCCKGNVTLQGSSLFLQDRIRYQGLILSNKKYPAGEETAQLATAAQGFPPPADAQEGGVILEAQTSRRRSERPAAGLRRVTRVRS